jgi:hypothetical protein
MEVSECISEHSMIVEWKGQKGVLPRGTKFKNITYAILCPDGDGVIDERISDILLYCIYHQHIYWIYNGI